MIDPVSNSQGWLTGDGRAENSARSAQVARILVSVEGFSPGLESSVFGQCRPNTGARVADRACSSLEG